MKPKVVITHWVHQEIIDYLDPDCHLVLNQTPDTLSRQEVLRRAIDAEGIMVFMPDKVNEPFLEACRSLKIIGAALKGYDNFDVAACTRHGIWFTIVSDLLTIPTAELAIGLLIGLTRHIQAGDTFVRNGKFKGWRPHFYGTGLSGRTAGIIGMGAVGKAVAKRLGSFDVKVIYTDPVPLNKEKEELLKVALVSLDELLARSDFVIPMVPLNSDTQHLLNIVTIAKMKPGSFLINTCRGSIVDEQAVAQSLADGHVSGYAADVFEMEDWARVDRPREIPQYLLDNHGKTLFTPHLGSAIDDIRRQIAMEAARNVIQALRGERPDGAINFPDTNFDE